MLGDVMRGVPGRAGELLLLPDAGRHPQTDEGSPFFRCLARTTGRREGGRARRGKLPRVAYIPGEFCVHPRGAMVEQGKRQLRFSYGYEELGRLEEAIGYMAEAARFAHRPSRNASRIRCEPVSLDRESAQG